ncbi:MAG: hypothetical protein WC959_03755 [Kiritimatiellales bacterium]
MKYRLAIFTAGVCIAAGVAAQDDTPWWKRLFAGGGSAPMSETAEEQPAPSICSTPEQTHCHPRNKFNLRNRLMMRPEQVRRGGPDMHRMPVEQMEKMRQQYQEIMKLGEAVRKETDAIKREELINQLRVHLTEISNRMNEMHHKRLEAAERDLERLKKSAAEMYKMKTQRVEEQLQRILSGEPMRPEGTPGMRKGFHRK